MRLIAVYCRVSSDDQRDRETIRTQQDTLERAIGAVNDIRVFRWYLDDGISGTVPMEQRPQGRLLMADARAGRFTEIWFTRASRLSRDEVEALGLYAFFEQTGITLVGVSEPVGDRTMFGFASIMHAAARRQFLADSAKGMERAAREGRYCGGIVPIGYMVEGKKPHARLVESTVIMWGEWTEAEVVRQIYGWVLIGWSAVKIADHMNALGIPTVYQKDKRLVRRGERKRRTDCVWRPGRILSIIKNPVYKGEYHYGRRAKRLREPIVATVPALINEEAWQAAQDALARNRIMPKNTERRYLLRSVMTCNLCGLTYGATISHDEVWYRCGGQTRYRANTGKRCPSVYLRARNLEPVIWSDVERFLRNPGDVLDELQDEREATSAAALREAERQVVEKALASIPDQRNRILALFRHSGTMTPEECDFQMADIAAEEEAYHAKLAELTPEEPADADEPDEDLLKALRSRLEGGLDEALRQEVVSILVRRITVTTEVVDGRKRGSVVVEYRFPGVVSTDTGTGSAPPRA